MEKRPRDLWNRAAGWNSRQPYAISVVRTPRRQRSTITAPLTHGLQEATPQVGEDNAVSLRPGETQHLVEMVAAPAAPGTYYYGACIDPVPGESDTSNNCSTGVRLEVGSVPQGDDHGDTESTATAITAPSSTRGELERPGDVDVFRFRLDFEPVRITVYTTGPTDTVGEIHRFGIFNSDDNSGDGLNFRIVVREHFDSPGSYYTVYVRGSGSSTGPYELHVSAGRAPPPRTDDHGDSRNGATRVSVPSDTDGVLTAGDTDYFRIDINGSGTLEVYTSGSTDTVGRLEDAGGSRLAENDDSGSGLNFRIEREVSTGTYYVRVRGVTGSTAGAYTLHVRFEVAAVDPADDHGDDRASATRVAVPSDTDWQSELLPRHGLFQDRHQRLPGRLQVYTSGSTDTRGRLQDANGNLLEDDDNSGALGNFRIEREVSSGTYYVRVRGLFLDTTGSYTLHVRLLESQDNHGDDRASATRVAVPSDTDGSLIADDTDYFRIDVSDSGTLQVYTSGSTDTRGRLEDANGSSLASDDNSGALGNFRIERDVSRGTYYIRVWGRSSSTTGSYALHVRFDGAVKPGDDHGDDRASATRVAVPSNTKGRLAVSDQDWFTFSLSARGYLEVYTTGTTDTNGTVEDERGLTLGSSGSGGEGDNFRLHGDVKGGTYWVRVERSLFGGGDGNYTLHVRFTEAVPDDHSDDRASSTRVAVPSDTDGTLITADTDYFRFDVSGSGRLEVYTSGDTNTFGTLEDASGNSLEENLFSGPGSNFRIERDVSSGTYYVRVTGATWDHTGSYTLHVRFTADAAVSVASSGSSSTRKRIHR